MKCEYSWNSSSIFKKLWTSTCSSPASINSNKVRVSISYKIKVFFYMTSCNFYSYRTTFGFFPKHINHFFKFFFRVDLFELWRTYYIMVHRFISYLSYFLSNFFCNAVFVWHVFKYVFIRFLHFFWKYSTFTATHSSFISCSPSSERYLQLFRKSSKWHMCNIYRTFYNHRFFCLFSNCRFSIYVIMFV